MSFFRRKIQPLPTRHQGLSSPDRALHDSNGTGHDPADCYYCHGTTRKGKEVFVADGVRYDSNFAPLATASFDLEAEGPKRW